MLDDIGVGGAVRAVAPPMHVVRLRKNDAIVDYRFSGGKVEYCPIEGGSTVFCKTPQPRLVSRSLTERVSSRSCKTEIAWSECAPRIPAGQEPVFRASLVVGADGRHSAVAHQVRAEEYLGVRRAAGDVLGVLERARIPMALQQVVFAPVAKSSSLRARIAATMEHQLSPLETFPARQVLGWMLGAVVRGSLRVIQEFIAMARRGSANTRELRLRQRFLAEAEASETQATQAVLYAREMAV